MAMRIVHRIIAAILALYSIGISILLWSETSANQSMWPFPALYFVEIMILGILVTTISLLDRPSLVIILWVTAGVFLAFVFLGVFSIGPFYIPAFLLSLTVAALAQIRHKGQIWLHLVAGLLGTLIQAGLMFLVIRLLSIFPQA